MKRVLMVWAACLLLFVIAACEAKKEPVTEKEKELRSKQEEMDGLVQE